MNLEDFDGDELISEAINEVKESLDGGQVSTFEERVDAEEYVAAHAWTEDWSYIRASYSWSTREDEDGNEIEDYTLSLSRFTEHPDERELLLDDKTPPVTEVFTEPPETRV